MVHKFHTSIGSAIARWHVVKRKIRKRFEGLERERFRYFGPPEEEIVEELTNRPPAELENRSIRELEVLARHDIGDWWGMDPSQKGPTKILTNHIHPSADWAESRIAIPDAAPELMVLRWYDAVIDRLRPDEYRNPLDANPDTPIIHDVYHEIGHIMARAAEDEEMGYTTLEEMVYEEALANVAVLEKLGRLTELQKERIETLESMLEESPESHIDDVLERRDQYVAVCDYAEDRLAELDPAVPPWKFEGQLTKYRIDMKAKRREHGVDDTGVLTPSVREAFGHDIFLFLVPFHKANVRATATDTRDKLEITMVAGGPEEEVLTTGEREPYSLIDTGIAAADNFLPFRLERRLLSTYSADYRLVVTAENMLRDVQRYIDRARSGVKAVDRDDLQQFRAHLINDHVERWAQAGHVIGVEVGHQLYQDPSLDAGELARLPQEEGIRQLRPLIEARQEQYGLSLPLETEIDYYDLEAVHERRERILTVIEG